MQNLSPLHPQKLRNNFSVAISTFNERLIESYTDVEKAVVSFDIGVENLGMPAITHTKSSVIMWLMDDEDSRLMTALRKIQQFQDPFVIELNMLHPDGRITEQFTFGGCRMSALQHSILSYESPSDSISLFSQTGVDPVLKGFLKASTARDTVMKLLQVEFSSYKHQIISSDSKAIQSNV